MKNSEKTIEQQFQELADKAKEVYPELNESLEIANSMRQPTEDLQNYLNLTLNLLEATTTNQITYANMGEHSK